MRNNPMDEKSFWGIDADAKRVQEMNNALAGAGGEAIVKLRIAEAIQGKRIMLLPVSGGGMNLKTTDMNRLIETLGIRSLSGGNDRGEPPTGSSTGINCSVEP